jgi:hypothetical protein
LDNIPSGSDRGRDPNTVGTPDHECDRRALRTNSGRASLSFLRSSPAHRVARGDVAPITLTSHRQILDHVWRPHLGRLPFLGIPHSMLIKIADAQN